MIIDSRIYCELAAWTDGGGVFASVSLVSCERVDQAEEPEYVDFVNLQKVEKKTIECLSPPFLGTGSNNCNWAAIAPVEKRLINIGNQIMTIIVVYDMLLCEDDFQSQPVERPATTSPGNCLLNLTRASL